MIKVALKGLAGRKLRAMLTAFAIVLGVAMVSGTYVLTDTIKAGFDSVFTTVYRSTDAIVSGKSAVGDSANGGLPPSFDASLLGKVRALPGVAEASGGVSDLAQFVGRNGKVLTTHGAPGLAFSVRPKGDQRFNPLVLTAGRYPQGPGEVAIDASTASRHHYAVGDTIGVVARGPVRQYRIAGVVKLGSVSSLGGATMAIFDLPTAQTLFDKRGKLDSISVAAKPGTTPQQLAREIRAILPPTAQVRTGEQQAAKDTQNTAQFTDILQKFLLAFGGIALFVGVFVIANTLSITIAQRAREFGTLRTLGATRRQLLSSVILEGLVIGALASLTGLFVGLGLAKGLTAVFVHVLHVDLPSAGTVFATRTIVVALVVGIFVTLIASLMPAYRATRVEPIAAVREGVLPPSRLERFGPYAAVVTLAVGIGLLAFGAFATGATTTNRLLGIGFGIVVVFLGMALLAPKFVPRLAQALGAPAAHTGVAGSLARENARRNPARTASTAAALMIGLALVTAVAVLATGLKARFESAVNDLFVADYVVTSENGFTPTSIASEQAVRKVPGVLVVSGVRADEGRLFGKRVQVTGVDRNADAGIAAKWIAGGANPPAHLGADGAFVSKSYAKDHGLAIGSPLVLETPSGRNLHLTLRGIFDPPKGGSPYGTITISSALFDRTYQSPKNVFAFVNVRGGVTDANTKTLDAALAKFPDAKLQTEAQFKKSQEQGINMLLNLLFVLLSLSIVVSLFGIVNTMVLSVFERTRELGMLRAVGMTKWQVWPMILAEGVVTALIGAALGIPLGVGIAALVGRAISFVAFAVPWTSLGWFVVAAVVVGLLAAVFPARRAARLNVLEALHYE